ncbi:DedA family protein [Pedomonas mirosovicensis]|uniref:DedA family protein n=1 Tax=Pedomonas mirosovicensis TaxID=2908641 RepID=UPI0021689D56|nr:DedA family protein [Pedomonas mirosovicensis]MCH8684191.1 DedA family protein [Pedomonas mirosovicensis]
MFEWMTGLIERGGYFGIAALMFLENVFPPIPSELIMPSAGFQASQGSLSLAGAIVAGTAGSLLGALFWYLAGRYAGEERLKRWAARHGRWLTLTPKDVDKADDWFDRYNASAVFFGRLLPAIRTLISVPAGLFEMKPGPFLLYSALGTAIWSAALATAGYLLGNNYHAVADYLNPATNVILGSGLLYYLYRVVTWRKDQKRPG